MSNGLGAVVGIGASAGGLEALQQFVQAIPKDSGVAFVIVQHLAPDHPSIMDKLLSAHAQVTVRKIEQGDRIEPGVVHVIPPGPFLEIVDSRFDLKDHDREEGVRTPIDRFFTSLAETAGRSAFGVILSGTGSDGTLGIRAIKSAGGVTMVQNSDSARFPGMPDSAAATGQVDFTLMPADMPDRILDILDYRARLEHGTAGEQAQDEITARLADMLAVVDADNVHGFGDYKPPTLIRRVQRRMSLLRQPSVEGYLKKLRESTEERELLNQDFLIGVTEFFRDPEIYAVLREKAVADIVASDAESLRVWVPGCSTGEEAYSIAITFLEEMVRQDRRRALQIFGTDVDMQALRHARNGTFVETALANVGPDLLDRYFRKNGATYTVISALREICVFAPHNLLRDPPFSRLDMISCRNVMIYLTGDAQKTVLPRFHYGLNPGGYLLLGPSETLGRSEDLFDTLDRTARLFRRNDRANPRFTALDARPSPRNQTRTPQSLWQSEPPGQTPIPQSLATRAEKAFLLGQAAPFAMVDDKGRIQHLSEAMTRFVRPMSGVPEPTTDSLLSRELRLPVHAALSERRETGARAEVRNVVTEIDGEARLFDVIATPMPEDDDSSLIVLQEVRQREGGDISLDHARAAGAEAVQRELTLANRRLETMEREYGNATQEAQSANEELLSMNEELQSANEELETSREELQSINEELETINAELTENNRQLIRANSDLKNFLESTEIATLFLDADLRVRRFTPGLSELYGVRERDLGREIADLAARVDYPELAEDASRVLSTLQSVSREVRIETTNQTFEVQVKPYRTVDDRLDGTVITFIDVSNRKRNERQLGENARVLREQLAELKTLYDSTPVGLSLVDRDLRWLRINPELAAINGFPVEDHIGRRQDELIPDIDTRIRDVQMQVLKTGKPVLGVEVQGETPAEPGVIREWKTDYYPIKDGDVTFAVGSCVQEVTDAKKLEREAQTARAEAEEYAARLDRVFGATPAFIAMHEGPEHVFTYCNPRQLEFFSDRDQMGRRLLDVFPELDDLGLFAEYDHVFRTGEPVTRAELRAPFQEGTSEPGDGWFRQTIQPWYHGDGNIGGVVTFAYEITEQVEARKTVERTTAQLQESEARMASLFDQAPAIISIFDGPEHRYLYTNRLHDVAVDRTDLIGQRMREALPELAGQGVFERFETVFETGEPYVTEELPAQVDGPDGPITYYQQIIKPWFREDGSIGGTMSFNTDITELVRARERLRVTTDRLTSIQNSLGSFLGLIAKDGTVLEANEYALASIAMAREDVVGEKLWDCHWWNFDTDLQDRLKDWIARAADGETIRAETEIQVKDDQRVLIDFQLVPAFDDDGNVVEIVPSGIDISAWKAAELRKDTLLAELQHRVKNMLATVQAITRFTARHTDTQEAMAAALTDRLAAISRTHDALTRTEWGGQKLHDILHNETAAYVGADGASVVIDGPDRIIDPHDALSLSLAIHELTTNAAKYGALSTDSGRVHVTITEENDALRSITWEETGGPPVEAPEGTGFGSFLLQQILPEDLDADVELDYGKPGVKISITFNR